MSVVTWKTFTGQFGPGNCNRQFGMFRKVSEPACFMALVRFVKPEVMVEIGVNKGKTAAAVLAEMPGIKRYVGIDVPYGSQMILSQQNKEVPVKAGEYALSDPRFEVILTRPGTVPELPQADFIYIDGDHSMSGVLRDTRAALKAIRANGCVVWHDYADDLGIKKVIDRLNEQGGDRIALIQNTTLCYTFDGRSLSHAFETINWGT